MTLAVLVAASTAGCALWSSIDADSTCGAYLDGDAKDRHAAAQRVSTDVHAYSEGNPMWGTSLDAECAAAPDTSLRAYFAAQEVLDTGGVSMERTINVGDKVVVNTLAYANAAPRRGEVILFKAPNSWSMTPNDRFIKRVIGIGGDHVVCCDPQRRITLNGRPLDEPYLYPDDPPSRDPFDISVPAGRLWVLGDHRSRSGDSLEHFRRMHDITGATIALDALVGRAYVVLDPANHDEPRSLAIPPTYADIPDPPRS